MILLLILAGFAALMAGTYRQSRELLGNASTPARRRALLRLGFSLLAASLVPVARDPDWARRLVEWFGDLSLAALLAIGFGWWRCRSQKQS